MPDEIPIVTDIDLIEMAIESADRILDNPFGELVDIPLSPGVMQVPGPILIECDPPGESYWVSFIIIRVDEDGICHHEAEGDRIDAPEDADDYQ